jgi:hypothetical protein
MVVPTVLINDRSPMPAESREFTSDTFCNAEDKNPTWIPDIKGGQSQCGHFSFSNSRERIREGGNDISPICSSVPVEPRGRRRNWLCTTTD